MIIPWLASRRAKPRRESKSRVFAVRASRSTRGFPRHASRIMIFTPRVCSKLARMSSDTGHLEAEAELILKPGIDRHQVVHAPVLKPMTGEVEQGGVGVPCVAGKLGNHTLH